MIRQVRAPEFEYPSQNTASSRQKWLAQRSLSPQHSNDRKGRTAGVRSRCDVDGGLKPALRGARCFRMSSTVTDVSEPEDRQPTGPGSVTRRSRWATFLSRYVS